jgi:hypothetical protein
MTPNKPHLAVVDEPLVDAKAIAVDTGYSVQYIRKAAATKKIPSYGIKNGGRIFRRFIKTEVREALRENVA